MKRRQPSAGTQATKKRLTLIEPPTLTSIQQEKYLLFEQEYEAYARRMKAIREAPEQRWELVESNIATQLLIVYRQVEGGGGDSQEELNDEKLEKAISHLFRIRDLSAQTRFLARYKMNGVGLPALGDFVVTFQRLAKIIQADGNDKAIAKTFIGGLSTLLRERIIPHDPKTLEDAIAKAYEIEMQISDALGIVKPERSHFNDRSRSSMKSDYGKRKSPQSYDSNKKVSQAHRPSKNTVRFQDSKKETHRRCYNCDERGHLAKGCPNSNSHPEKKPNVCWRCGEEGHFANDPKCPKKVNRN